jgi:LCP family protein required for cell wall assembly
LIILIGLIGTGWWYINNLFDQMEQVEIDQDDLGIEEPEPETNLTNNEIINIALFGIDTRNGDYQNSLSDTIMIATVDFQHKKLKLTSVMRDTYASVPGNGYNKINSAYASGGPSLAIKTLNTNLDLNITDFVTVNFEALEKTVDAVGGVEIELQSYEVYAYNDSLSYLNSRDGMKQKGFSSAGVYQMNGRQALAYSRVRAAGKSDFERTERQRRVLEQVLNKVLLDRSITKAMRFTDSLLPYIKTSMSRKEILAIGTKIFTTGTYALVNTRIPLDENVKNANIRGAAVLLPDSLLDNVTYLHNFIYENDQYAPSERLLKINNDMPTQ